MNGQDYGNSGPQLPHVCSGPWEEQMWERIKSAMGCRKHSVAQ